jgi:hypothetical protein
MVRPWLRGAALVGAVAALAPALSAPPFAPALAAPRARAPLASVETVAAGADRGPLRIRNQTPFIVIVYLGGIRSGWVRPFKTQVFSGMKDGYHRVYAHSQYGSHAFGPQSVWVPGTFNIKLGGGKLGADADTAIASRVYSRNRSSLVACDRLAERRGEGGSGQRIDFAVRVSAKGAAVVGATGAGLSDALRSCYQAIARGWSFPVTGSAYEIDFQHIR